MRLSSTTLGQECVLKQVPFMTTHAFLFKLKPLVAGLIPKGWLEISCNFPKIEAFEFGTLRIRDPGHRTNEVCAQQFPYNIMITVTDCTQRHRR